MTISHFYFVAACAVWIYILLCCTVKLVLDRFREAGMKCRCRRIRRYFSPCSAGKISAATLRKYAKNDALLTCACESYSKNVSSYGPEEKRVHEKDVFEMLFYRSERLKNPDIQELSLIASMSQLCGVPVRKIEKELLRIAPYSAPGSYWGARLEKRAGRNAERG